MPHSSPETPLRVLTLAMGALALTLVWARLGNRGSGSAPTLRELDRRVATLRAAVDPIAREALCNRLSAYGRHLDRTLPAHARVFLAGMLGEENGSRLGIYYFLRNYLFPRDVAISRDGKAIFHEGWFEGLPADEPGELRAAGFDVLVEIGPSGAARVTRLEPGR
jgi:hypothetical protein